MVTYLHIRAISQSAVKARLSIGHLTLPCWLGRTGTAFRKREGDGKTPIGAWQLQQGFFRADRLRHPLGGQKLKVLRRDMGWCELPSSGHYNKQVKLPFRHAHESMWRDDNAYDIVIATSHNTRPRVKGLGSAIFFHLLRDGADCTAGCFALKASDMRKVLARLSSKVVVIVWPPGGQPRSLPRTRHCQP